MPKPLRARKILRPDVSSRWPSRIVTWATRAAGWLHGAGADTGPVPAWTLQLSTAERVHAEFFVYR